MMFFLNSSDTQGKIHHEEFVALGKKHNVPTLIARDGVHPSNTAAFSDDYSEEALRNNGYGLRNYLTLLAYAAVIDKVCQPVR